MAGKAKTTIDDLIKKPEAQPELQSEEAKAEQLKELEQPEEAKAEQPSLADMVANYSNEELLEILVRRGVDQKQVLDIELKKQTDEQINRVKSPRKVIKDRSKLTPAHMLSSGAVYIVRNRTTKSVSLVNGKFYAAEKDNQNYMFEFSHYETTEFKWSKGII